MSNTHSTTGIARRTVIKGAAWSAPIIAAAVAAPLAAASGDPAPKATLSSAWYSCNNGTWKFTFEPEAGVSVSSITATAAWMGTVSLKGKRTEWEMKPNGSKQHYTTEDGPCALDHLKADSTVFIVMLSDGTTVTINAATYTGPFSMGHPENCGPCAA